MTIGSIKQGYLFNYSMIKAVVLLWEHRHFFGLSCPPPPPPNAIRVKKNRFDNDLIISVIMTVASAPLMYISANILKGKIKHCFFFFKHAYTSRVFFINPLPPPPFEHSGHRNFFCEKLG